VTLDESDSRVKAHLSDPKGFAQFIINQFNTERIYDECLRGKTDLTILDIGANVGLFTLYAQDSAKRLIAVEPTPSHHYVFEKLTAESTNVELAKVALCDVDGPIEFYISDENSTTNSIVNKHDRSIQVEGLCLESLLDKYNLDRVHFCKIDIEGSEIRAVTVETLGAVFDRIDEIFIECHATVPNFTHDDIIANRIKMEEVFLKVGYKIKVVNFDTIHAYKATKVLVTGRNGFIARQLIKQLELNGHTVYCSGHLKAEKVATLLDEIKPDIIYHLGAELKNSREMFETNVMLTQAIIEWCATHRVERLVLFGSSSEYGNVNKPRSEKDLPLPTNMYEATKSATAMLARGAAYQYNIPTLFIRPFTIYGEDEKPTKLTQILFQKMKDGTVLKLSDGFHDYVYINDFVDILMTVVSQGPIDQFTLLNIGTGWQTTNIQFVNTFQKVTGYKFPVEIIESVGPPSWMADTALLESKFKINLAQARNLESGIRRMVSAYKRRNGEENC
jgi:FkbM family methyltransferase